MSFNNKFGFTILNLNIRSLANLNNYSKFETLIISFNPQPDIISLTETWLIEQSGPHCSLIGYTFVDNCRKCFRGGGVGFYVKIDLNLLFVKSCQL